MINNILKDAIINMADYVDYWECENSQCPYLIVTYEEDGIYPNCTMQGRGDMVDECPIVQDTLNTINR